MNYREIPKGIPLVYFYIVPSEEICKIGFTCNIKERFCSLRYRFKNTWDDFKARAIFCKDKEEAKEIEHILLACTSAYRLGVERNELRLYEKECRKIIENVLRSHDLLKDREVYELQRD